MTGPLLLHCSSKISNLLHFFFVIFTSFSVKKSVSLLINLSNCKGLCRPPSLETYKFFLCFFTVVVSLSNHSCLNIYIVSNYQIMSYVFRTFLISLRHHNKVPKFKFSLKSTLKLISTHVNWKILTNKLKRLKYKETF